MFQIFLKNNIKDVRVHMTAKEISEAIESSVIVHLKEINNVFEIEIPEGKWVPFRYLEYYSEEVEDKFFQSTNECIKQRKQYIRNISRTHTKITKISTIVWQNVLRYESTLQNIIDKINIRLAYSKETILHHLFPTIFHPTNTIIASNQPLQNQKMYGIIQITKTYYFYILLELFKIHASQGIRSINQYRQDHQLYIEIQQHDCNKLIQYYKSNTSDFQYFECIGGMTQLSIFNIIDEYINHLEHDKFIKKLIFSKIHSLSSSQTKRTTNTT